MRAHDDDRIDAAADPVQAYGDGELRGFARWRFEQRLRSDPALQQELAAWRRLGGWVRETGPVEASPDLWDRIAPRLPALDAQRAGARAPAPGGLRLWQPLGAAALAASLVAAFLFGFEASRPEALSAVRWLDGGKRSVLVIEGEASPGATIIWVIEDEVEGAQHGGRRDVA